MPTRPARPNGSQSNDLPEDLTERVLARVTLARVAVDRRAKASRPKAKPRRAAAPVSAESPSVDEIRESESLKKVFREMGISYRRYRSQTGDPVTPGLRDAAYNFRAEPSLTSLVAVAAYLDELDLLS
jgi:hypothetical protein